MIKTVYLSFGTFMISGISGTMARAYCFTEARLLKRPAVKTAYIDQLVIIANIKQLMGDRHILIIGAVKLPYPKTRRCQVDRCRAYIHYKIIIGAVV
jgi:hypothetical protein